MLDKSIPYFNILMIRKPNTELNDDILPIGFHYEFFQPGDEKNWADIETSVLEFPNQSDALSYFKKEYLMYPNELTRRCVFISTNAGEKIGTATAWWSTRNQKKVPSIHWVSIKPEFQNLGLGKSLVNKILRISMEMDGDVESYIHTQTWSYPAIGIYLKAGYKILRKGTFASYRNDYKKALPLLHKKMGIRFSIERDTTFLDGD